MLPYPLKRHQLDKEVDPVSPPKRRRHTHRDAHNRFYKPTLRAFTPAVPFRLLDGFALLDAAKVELPQEVVTVHLPGERLARVEMQDLRYFTNLAALSLPDNQLRLEDFCSLTGLVERNSSMVIVTGVVLCLRMARPMQPMGLKLVLRSLGWTME